MWWTEISIIPISVFRAAGSARFSVLPDMSEGYVLSWEELARKLEETIALGGTGILLQGGLNPDLPLAYYEELVRFIRRTGSDRCMAFLPRKSIFFAKTFRFDRCRGIAASHRRRTGLHTRRRRRDPGGPGAHRAGPA